MCQNFFIMIKSVFALCFMLLAASAEIYEFDNFIEYEPEPSISLPYPYKLIDTSRPVFDKKIIVPASTEVVEVVKPTGFISTVISSTFNVLKSIAVFFISRAPGVLTGIVTALGLCKLTSICDSQITVYEVETEFRSIATPERLTRAANFVTEALKKYSEVQNS